jgi:hypothetical protein
MNVINVTTQLLAYSDPTLTDNPQLKSIDWTRRLFQIAVSNPMSDAKTLYPGESFQIFDGTRTTTLDGTSVLEIKLLSNTANRYRIKVTSGNSGFRTGRLVFSINNVTVQINNNAIANFDFTGANISNVQVGDTMRISGQLMYDSGPFVFNPLNAGIWKVIGINGTVVQAVRPTGESFSAANESVTGASSQVSFYSSSGVQVGDKVSINDTFSTVSRRSYEVLDVTPDSFDFVSGISIPEESGLTYIPGSLVFYSDSKKLVYIEVDQDAVVRFNDDSSDNNKVTPISAGNQNLIGYLHKFGDSYKVTVINRSINTMNVKFFTCE